MSAEKSADSGSEAEPGNLPPHLTAVSGLLMGGADAIPGVSGGTIALILGIYERFISSLEIMVRSPILIGRPEGRAQIVRALGFLLPLGLGIAVAYFLATKLLVGKTEEPGLMLRPEAAPICYGFFFGLVLVSLREPWRQVEHHTAAHFVAALLGCAAAAIFVGLPKSGGDPETWMLLLGGAGAISVMLLPGVSGSLFLVIIGQYAAVAGAVHNRDLIVLLVFLAGIALGAIAFVPALRFLLRRYHGTTMAALTGLMAGSLRALWPFKDGYDPKHDAMNNIGINGSVHWVALAAVGGGAVVILLAVLEARIQRAGHG